MHNESFPENVQSSGQEIGPIGPKLRDARERLGLTITDIARQLRLTNERIEALENDDYQNMPGITFVKGYLRGYARLINLPADEVIMDFDRLNLMPEPKSFILSSHKSPSFNNKSMRWLVYLIGVVVLISMAVWWSSFSSTDPANLNSAALPHQTTKNPTSAATPANTGTGVNSSNLAKNSENSASAVQPTPAKEGELSTTPTANSTDASQNQSESAAAAQSTSVASTSSTTPSTPTESSETQTTVGDNTTAHQEDSDEPSKKSASRSHLRPKIAEPFE